jgi:murein peptide amidase A
MDLIDTVKHKCCAIPLRHIYKIFIFVILCAVLFPANAISFKKHFFIVRKAISVYKKMPSSKVHWNVLGKSTLKKRIYIKQFGRGENLIMIIGGIHGDEPTGILSAVKLAEYIRIHPKSIKNRVVIIPCVNPDGLYDARRTNANLVDINRNFPSESWSPEYEEDYNDPGMEPGSEIETKLVMKAVNTYKPSRIIQIHQPFNGIFPTENVSAELMTRLSEISGIQIKYDLGYPTPGSLEHYDGYKEYNIQGITYELGDVDTEPDYPKIINSLIEAINFKETITVQD